jgi:hypothetical protein
MVVSDALGVTALGPPAKLTMGDGVWVGVERGGGDLSKKALLDPAVVGVELRDPETVPFTRAEDDVGALGIATLETSYLLAVEAKLEKVVGLRSAGELRVGDLIAPCAEI